jgi:hypothetical protein
MSDTYLLQQLERQIQELREKQTEDSINLALSDLKFRNRQEKADFTAIVRSQLVYGQTTDGSLITELAQREYDARPHYHPPAPKFRDTIDIEPRPTGPQIEDIRPGMSKSQSSAVHSAIMKALNEKTESRPRQAGEALQLEHIRPGMSKEDKAAAKEEIIKALREKW